MMSEKTVQILFLFVMLTIFINAQKTEVHESIIIPKIYTAKYSPAIKGDFVLFYSKILISISGINNFYFMFHIF